MTSSLLLRQLGQGTRRLRDANYELIAVAERRAIPDTRRSRTPTHATATRKGGCHQNYTSRTDTHRLALWKLCLAVNLAMRKHPQDPALVTENPRSNDKPPRSGKRTAAALGSGLRGSQLAHVAITMLITYSISLAALMWNHRDEGPPLAPAGIDAPVRQGAQPVVMALPQSPPSVAPMPARLAEIAPVTPPVQNSQPTALMAEAAVPALPAAMSSDSAAPKPLTPAQLQIAANTCDREIVPDTPLCRRYRGEN